MTRRHVGGDVGSVARGPLLARRRAAWAAALLGSAALVLPLAACSGEDPMTEPPDPGAPITRSPS